MDQKPPAIRRNGIEMTLADRCRVVIVNDLERYPPEAFSILELEEWNKLVQLKDERTRPTKFRLSTPGLDGTGRLVPAVSHQFLDEIESKCPHFADSTIADTLLWRNCVEKKFRRGGLTRPASLLQPWPELVQAIKSAAETVLNKDVPDETKSAAVNVLSETPMNVSLLRDSGAGKLVKKAIKRGTLTFIDHQVLQQVLSSWMDIASRDQAATASSTNAANLDDDLAQAEQCVSWRQLFHALQRREEHVRNSQGKRMRAIRRELAKSRPKLVKVRPSSKKQEAILDLSKTKSPPTASSKIGKLRQEAKIQVIRQRRTMPTAKASFGDAVAFATNTTKGDRIRKRKIGGTIQRLGNGKTMKVPVARRSRKVVPKWKK